MYISEIYASGFRCFSATQPLQLALQEGLNIIVGPNDAGKTAIIDAPRHVLWTRGDEFVRLDINDFHVDETGARTSNLLIRCTFDGLSPREEARFLEWCSNEGGRFRLHVCLRGTLRAASGGGHTVISQYRAGRDGDGQPLEGDLREYLKSTYLRPLRDAERELRSGRRSRLSRILGALPTMAAQAKSAEGGAPATLVDTLRAADRLVDENPGVQSVQDAVNTQFLDRLSFSGDELKATLGLGAKGSFDQILERFELYLNPAPGRTERTPRGLGYNNLLFMAAELLLLQSHPDQVPFLLIEEPEAHLHPQHQSLFMQMLERHSAASAVAGAEQNRVQILLTTHSPHLAANAKVESLVLMAKHAVYPLAKGQTRLDADDYSFLRRFLDATKANLFFARGLLMVEGDAENILLPAIARKMGRPLEDHGVSIVNVGHVGLFRYSRILQRTAGPVVPTPVALLHDRDIPPDAAKAMVGERKTESEWDAAKKATRLANMAAEDGQCVRAFISDQWTLEFDFARNADLAALMHRAIRLAGASRRSPRAEVIADADKELAEWNGKFGAGTDAVAVEIFRPLHDRKVSKTEAAEQLADLVDKLADTPEVFRAKCPQYLREAIDYVTSRPAVAAAPAGAT
jgi:putative ATP-dependent endonuclease of OLD family